MAASGVMGTNGGPTSLRGYRLDVSGLANWGDVPSWVAALGTTGTLGQVLWATRAQRASDFGERLRDATGLDDESLAERIASNPDLGAVVLDGVEEAMRARAEEKRWLLAKVVAAAFDGDDARVGEIDLLLHTATALEAPHIRALVYIAGPHPQRFEGSVIAGAMDEGALGRELGGVEPTFVRPILSTLAREGLVIDHVNDTIDRIPAWSASPYAYRFLQFLPGEPLPQFEKAELVAIREAETVRIRNLGFGPAVITSVRVTALTNDHVIQNQPIPLGAGEAFSFLEVGIGNMVSAHIRVTWTNPDGTDGSRVQDIEGPSQR